MIYSCRAECAVDIDLFLATAKEKGVVIECEKVTLDKDFPDEEIEFQSTSTLEQIQVVLNGCIDCHVMLETLRPIPLTKNSLERDWSVSEKFINN